jgi:hypothetical protein
MSYNRSSTALAVVNAQEDSSLLTIYPNPVQTELTVSLRGSNKIISVRVVDIIGRNANVRYLGNGKVDVASIPAGIYVINVSDGQHEYHQKFTKE